MLIVGACCLALVLLTTLLHYEVLRALNAGLASIAMVPRAKLLVVVLAAFSAHCLEILLYAFAFYLLSVAGFGHLGDPGRLSLDAALYFSAETYTSLGYGDVVPADGLRLLAGVEALNGLLLIGWSASYMYIAMERFWKEHAADARDDTQGGTK